jgi:hypothetical protein
MTTLAITVSVSNPDAEDRQAMEDSIDRMNEPIVAQNLIFAAQTPPGTPIALWPKSTAPERKTSYEEYLRRNNVSMHLSYVEQSNTVRENVERLRLIRKKLPFLSNAQLLQIEAMS